MLLKITDLVTLGYVKSLHEDNERNRRDLGINLGIKYDESSDLVKNNQTNDLNDKIILNVGSIEINNESLNDNHCVNKKYVDDEFISTTDSTIVKNNNHNDMNNYTRTNVNNIQINNTPTQDNQVTNKKYVDDNIDDNLVLLRLNDDSNEKLSCKLGKFVIQLIIYKYTTKLK